MCHIRVWKPLAGAVAGAALLWAPIAHASPLADLVEEVSPAVVTVVVTREDTPRQTRRATPDTSPFEEFFRRFGRPDQMPQPRGNRRSEGLGSGFILDRDGHIVTNNHVVEDGDSVRVRLQDRREFDAEVIGTDPETDLALLRIEADEPLPTVTLGDSDAMRVGDDVVAVGNPFGLGGTVTSGIISAKGRDVFGGPYVDFLQTDAAINRGNSGGPLFNMAGEVIGVNSAIYSPSGGSVGVGFAVPSNIVATVVAELVDDGTVDRGWLGVSIQDVTADLAEALGLDAPRGALVAEVIEGSPAEGILQTGDVILGFGAGAVDTRRDLPRLVGATDAGDMVDVRILRAGAEQIVRVTVGDLAGRSLAAATPADATAPEAPKLDATIAPITEEVRQNLGLAPGMNGVVITSVQSGGAADRAGLRTGDVVLKVGQAEIATPGALRDAIAGAGEKPVLFLVQRAGRNRFVSVDLAG